MTPEQIAKLIIEESETVQNLDPISRIYCVLMRVSNEIMKLMLEARDRREGK